MTFTPTFIVLDVYTDDDAPDYFIVEFCAAEDSTDMTAPSIDFTPDEWAEFSKHHHPA